MRFLLPAILLLSATAALAQETSGQLVPLGPAECSDPHSVDDYITALHKRQRNKNPLPSDVCLFGGCIDTGVRPPEPKPPESRSNTTNSANPANDSSSSKTQNDDIRRQLALDEAIKASKNVEVADEEFENKNYRAALSRYLEAMEQKPGDIAIHIRLAKTYELLVDPTNAYAHYYAALLLDDPGRASRIPKGIGDAIERVRPSSIKGQLFPKTPTEPNTAMSDPCLAGRNF